MRWVRFQHKDTASRVVRQILNSTIEVVNMSFRTPSRQPFVRQGENLALEQEACTEAKRTSSMPTSRITSAAFRTQN